MAREYNTVPRTSPDTEYFSNNYANNDFLRQSEKSDHGSCGCCTRSCLENVILICNILIFMLGGGLLGLGVYLIINRQSYLSALMGHLIFSGHYLVIGAGGLVVLVALLGCAGALRKSAALLRAYAVLLALMLLVALTAGALSLVFNFQLRQRVVSGLRQSMLSADFSTEGAAQNARARQVDVMHQELRCCGVLSFLDWHTSTFGARRNASRGRRYDGDNGAASGVAVAIGLADSAAPLLLTPLSCCRSPGPGCAVSAHPSNLYVRGCADAVAQRLQQDLRLLAPVAFSIGLVQALSLVMACALICVLPAGAKPSKTR